MGNAVSPIILILIVVRMDEILKSEPELERYENFDITSEHLHMHES